MTRQQDWDDAYLGRWPGTNNDSYRGNKSWRDDPTNEDRLDALRIAFEATQSGILSKDEAKKLLRDIQDPNPLVSDVQDEAMCAELESALTVAGRELRELVAAAPA